MSKDKKEEAPKAPEVPKGPKEVVFILVQEIGKAPFKGGVLVSQDIAVIENGQLVTPESTDRLDPDGFGMFSWSDDHPNNARRLKAMLQFQKKNNRGETPFIVGPFDSRGKAAKEMQKVRPKADGEKVALLRKEVDEQAIERVADQELIVKLRKQIADANGKSAQ